MQSIVWSKNPNESACNHNCDLYKLNVKWEGREGKYKCHWIEKENQLQTYRTPIIYKHCG